MQKHCAIVLLFLGLYGASPSAGQPAGMTADEQAWFSCLISHRWCVTASANQALGKDRLIAMVSSKKPARVYGRVSRVTFQVGCSGEKPEVMLMTGLKIETRELILKYRIDPLGTGSLVAKHASSGHFFELSDPDFLRELKNANTVFIDLVVPDDAERAASKLEFDLRGGSAVLSRLSCLQSGF